jgi:hypothetical protein
VRITKVARAGLSRKRPDATSVSGSGQAFVGTFIVVAVAFDSVRKGRPNSTG